MIPIWIEEQTDEELNSSETLADENTKQKHWYYTGVVYICIHKP